MTPDETQEAAEHATVPQQRHTCSGCNNTWTGQGRAHATCCHRTFNTSRLFDLHRSAYGEHGGCIDPETVTNKAGERMLFLRNGLWCGPEMSDEQKARLYGTRDAA